MTLCVILSEAKNRLTCVEGILHFVQDDNQNMDKDAIQNFFTQRRTALEALKPLMSPNFFELVGEKINHEEEALMLILHGKIRTQESMREYSFVLDERYFEQKLTPKASS